MDQAPGRRPPTTSSAPTAAAGATTSSSAPTAAAGSVATSAAQGANAAGATPSSAQAAPAGSVATSAAQGANAAGATPSSAQAAPAGSGAAPDTGATPSTAEPAPAASSGAPAATPSGVVQPGGLRALLPLAGEYAVTANLDDRTLSVVPIGAAAVAGTVQLDLAPSTVSAEPNSDTVLAADGAPSGHLLAVASLNTSSQSTSIDVGSGSAQVASPPPTVIGGSMLVISADNTIRSVDPATQALGAPQQLGAGPHSVSVAPHGAMASQQVYVTNAGDGTVTVLDQQASAVQATLSVGGRPVGAVRTIDGRLWVADGDAGTVVMLDQDSGRTLQTVNVGPNLTGLAATPDGHFLALSSSDADAALYTVDLFAGALGTDVPVRHLGVPGGVLALATGAKIGRAYATTSDGYLLYLDLDTNTISQRIAVGHNPVGLALGLVDPPGPQSPSPTAAP